MNQTDPVSRISRMEHCFDTLTHVLRTDPRRIREDAGFQEMLRILTEYYQSGQWLADYEADERGEIPRDLKRGVLSQDGLWNLLQSIDIPSPGRYNRSSEQKEEFP